MMSFLKKYLLLGLFALSAWSGLMAQNNSAAFEAKTYVASNGDTLLYRILYPENYDSTRAYPLFLVLHGAGERGNDNEKQLVHGSALFLNPDNRAKYPCIVLFPQCPQDTYWASVGIDRSKMPFSMVFDYQAPIKKPLAAAIELTQSFVKTKKADKKRVYITGLSMGGMGTFEAVYRFPKLFAAAAPICGGGDAAAYRKKHVKIPFWLFHGAEDVVVSVTESQKMYARLQALKANVQYTEYPKVNHDSWNNAFAEPNFLDWFFTKKR